MNRRDFLLLVALFLASCAPIIKPLELTATPAPTSPIPATSPAPSGTPAPITAHVIAYSLNVRQTPDEYGLVLGYLYHGNQVELTEKCTDDGWAEIIWNGGTAWVNADYLSDNLCKE